jgi:hypothetical protein
MLAAAGLCLWLGAFRDPARAEENAPGAPSAANPVIDGYGRPIPCRCRAGGRYYELGDLVCMATPSGPVLTRCGVVLNNTSWTPTREPCTLSEEARSGRHAAAAPPGR